MMDCELCGPRGETRLSPIPLAPVCSRERSRDRTRDRARDRARDRQGARVATMSQDLVIDGERTTGQDVRTANGAGGSWGTRGAQGARGAVARRGATGGAAGRKLVGPHTRAGAVTACVALANIVRSSLGPVGLDKMLVRGVPRPPPCVCARGGRARARARARLLAALVPPRRVGCGGAGRRHWRRDDH